MSTGPSENPFPPAESDEKQAENFANYFMDKIDKTRKKFEGIDPYKPESNKRPRLRKFSTMTEQEVLKIINSMKTKSCELDSLSTRLLKLFINTCLPLITKIINISLENGITA